ncbi:MAG: hypothetical protein HOM80_10340, partial [Bacteroidetes bacterium]|nr:hypothetical protein [Bacteroidota bacterium]
LEKNDFLLFQLYTASKSVRIKRKKIRSWILLTLGSIFFTFYFHLDNSQFLTYYFLFCSFLVGFFFPKYFKWRYKKHYLKNIKEHYSNRFGIETTLEFTDAGIHTKDKTGESKINISEVEIVNETMYHYFIKISSGMSLIIPKSKITEPKILMKQFEKMKLSINKELNWKW